MLVRVSTIHADEREAYRVQDRFARGMLAAVGMNGRLRLMGAATAGSTAARR